jgi:antitoxin VapB
MAENTVDGQVAELLDHLANLTGETRREALLTAVRERISREKLKLPARQRRHAKDTHMDDELDRIVRRFSALPVADHRSAEEIIGYDVNGLL